MLKYRAPSPLTMVESHTVHQKHEPAKSIKLTTTKPTTKNSVAPKINAVKPKFQRKPRKTHWGPRKFQTEALDKKQKEDKSVSTSHKRKRAEHVHDGDDDNDDDFNKLLAIYNEGYKPVAFE